MRKLSLTEVDRAAYLLAQQIERDFPENDLILAYPVPRGGVPAAYAVGRHLQSLRLVSDPVEADCIIDDLVDSGATRARFGKPFYALFDKQEDPELGWLIFPWEGSEEGSAEDIVVRLLQFIGEDPARGGLRETPARVLRAWRHWCRGYAQNPAEIMKVFDDGAERVDEMVVVKDIPIYSHCEHHLAPFFGVAHVAYIPNGRIVGLSKLSRLVDVFAARLQVQERLTNQIADALDEHLRPLGVGVVLRCRHLCMESRGIQRQGATTITSALRGALKDKPEARAEFMGLAR